MRTLLRSRVLTLRLRILKAGGSSSPSGCSAQHKAKGPPKERQRAAQLGGGVSRATGRERRSGWRALEFVLAGQPRGTSGAITRPASGLGAGDASGALGWQGLQLAEAKLES